MLKRSDEQRTLFQFNQQTHKNIIRTDRKWRDITYTERSDGAYFLHQTKISSAGFHVDVMKITQDLQGILN
jgi:hypothetical protein